jgi:hypothetical protein
MDATLEPGRFLNRDIAAGESAERELDRFVSSRYEKRARSEGHRPSEELWAASERAYFARRESQSCLELLTFHEGQAARLSGALGALVAHHQAEAEKYRNRLTK